MNKINFTKTMVLLLSFMLIFSLAIIAIADVQPETGTVSVRVDAKPSGGWSKTDDLYVNVTPITTPDFGRCFGGWGNSTSFNTTISYTWGYGNQSHEFYENYTANYSIVSNGNSTIFNFPDIGENGKFSYYFRVFNISEGLYAIANCSNISILSSTYNFWIDTTVPSITLDRPRTNSTNGDVYFNATVIETNPNYCYLYVNGTGTDPVLNHTWNYLNNTVFETTKYYPDANYSYYIKCDDDAGNVKQSANKTFIVDSGIPTITEITANNSWSNTAATLLKFDVTDLNLQTCSLYANFSDAGSHTLILNQTNKTMKSGDDVTFKVGLSDTTYPTPYYYNVTCNDTFGHRIWLTGRAINVDTVAPSPANFTMPIARISTDHTPNITHFPSIENNFLTYALNFYTASTGVFYNQVNYSTTNMSYGTTFTTYLLSDVNYTFNLTTYDRAGNIGTTGKYNLSISYKTDSTCWKLYEDYNFCGILRNGWTNLGTIAAESKAQYVYKWNGSWVSYTAGSTTNYYENLTRGEVAVIYINSTGPYEWEDRKWSFNNTMTGSVLGALYLDNTTLKGSGYSLVSIAQNMTGVNFTQLETSITKQNYANGTHIQYLTYINNSVLGDSNNNQQYYPFRYGKNFNEVITIDFGEAMWWFNSNWTKKESVNWSRSIGGAG